MISVYEMKYKRCDIPSSDIECIPFDESYIEQYMMHYNDAFYPMRKALDIKPYNWYVLSAAVSRWHFVYLTRHTISTMILIRSYSWTAVLIQLQKKRMNNKKN